MDQKRDRRIFIAGATGVLGRRLVEQLSRDHSVAGLARTDEKARVVRELGGEPVRADLFDPDELAGAAEGADVVIHAATAIPTGRDAMKRSAWKLNDRIRTEGTRALTAAAAAVGARRYIQQSVAWVVETEPGGPAFDEDTPPSPPAMLASAVEGEEIAREAGARHAFEVAVLRNGVFYAADAAHTLETAENLRKRRPVVLGKGDSLVAPVHVDDAARAFVRAVDADGDALWHVVDDEPVPSLEWHSFFARLLDAKRPRRVPLWLARLLAGKDAVAAVTTSMNTSNARIRRELGWVPEFSTYRDGLRAIVEEWTSGSPVSVSGTRSR